MNKLKNSLITNERPKTFAEFVNSDAIRNRIIDTLGERKLQSFMTSIITAFNKNDDLKSCNANSILSAGLLGEALNLSPSAEMGQYYLVPFKDNKKGITVAQFQLGYKGYIQLAMRTGQYKKIIVVAVKEDEMEYWNPFTEEIKVNFIKDDVERENARTMGYYAGFELNNGFSKSIYFSKEKMEKHALQYSKGYKKKTGYTFWEKDFDEMGRKTMIRQLISKWGILSPDLEKAIITDMGEIDDNMEVTYIDNDEPIEAEVVKEEPKQIKETEPVEEVSNKEFEEMFFG